MSIKTNYIRVAKRTNSIAAPDHHSDALLIFIKNAKKGLVKTRLAASVGDDKALHIYKALLGHTRKIALATKAHRLLFYSPTIVEDDNWSAVDFDKHVQEGDDLGARMEAAFRFAFQQHEKVLIIGSDCASLTSTILSEAFQLLDTYDFVIGPALDGGYYLLGMTQPETSLFREMNWSTATVFTETIQRINNTGRSYALLPELSDIDYIEDWERYGWKLEE